MDALRYYEDENHIDPLTSLLWWLIMLQSGSTVRTEKYIETTCAYFRQKSRNITNNTIKITQKTTIKGVDMDCD